MDLKGHEQLLSELRTKYPNAVLDGAVNEESWNKLSNNRILWILKEVNDYPGDLRNLLKQFANDSNPSGVYAHWKNTYGAVVQVSRGIINGCAEWGTWADNIDGIRNVLNEIAVINVNKLGGGSASDPKVLAESAEKFHDVIVKQIELLDPNIVILGGTKDAISKWLPMDDASRKWIAAPHPAQRNITHQEYYDLICKEVSK